MLTRCPMCKLPVLVNGVLLHFDQAHRKELASGYERLNALFNQVSHRGEDLANALMKDLSLPFFVFIVPPEGQEERWRVVVSGKLTDWRENGDIAMMACWKALFAAYHHDVLDRADIVFLADPAL